MLQLKRAQSKERREHGGVFRSTQWQMVLCRNRCFRLEAYLTDRGTGHEPAGLAAQFIGRAFYCILNSIIRWMARSGPMSDLDLPLSDEMTQRFREVQAVEYDAGHTFVIAGRKGGGDCSGVE